MARTTTKTDLTIAADGQFGKLWKLIDSMTEEAQNAESIMNKRPESGFYPYAAWL